VCDLRRVWAYVRNVNACIMDGGIMDGGIMNGGIMNGGIMNGGTMNGGTVKYEFNDGGYLFNELRSNATRSPSNEISAHYSNVNSMIRYSLPSYHFILPARSYWQWRKGKDQEVPLE
jgi:hypothetical protein